MLVLLGNVVLKTKIGLCPFGGQPVFAAVVLPLNNDLPVIFANGLGDSAIARIWISVPGNGRSLGVDLTAPVG